MKNCKQFFLIFVKHTFLFGRYFTYLISISTHIFKQNSDTNTFQLESMKKLTKDTKVMPFPQPTSNTGKDLSILFSKIQFTIRSTFFLPNLIKKKEKTNIRNIKGI